jgi:enoyl-CoA hydratase
MEYLVLKYQEESGIGILTISRPEVRNALNARFFEEFNDFLHTIRTSETTRVLIITGTANAFAAGADISELKEIDAHAAKILSKNGQAVFNLPGELDIPVIAAVNGYALGGGCELALACDIRIAGSNAVFGLPEVGLGLIPGYGATQRLSRLTGLGDALMMILSGQSIDAAEALRIGLVQKVTDPQNLINETKKLAIKIASMSSVAVKTAKIVIRNGLNMQTDRGFELEAEYFSKMFGKDGPEGMKAFLEKRKPDWNE